MANKFLCIVLISCVPTVILDTSCDTEITFECLKCFYMYINGANYKNCNGDVCGRFDITRDYWSEAGSINLKNEVLESEDAYENCVTDSHCNIQTIRSYMRNHVRDCNDDGILNCYDFFAVHMHGVDKCENLNFNKASHLLSNTCNP